MLILVAKIYKEKFFLFNIVLLFFSIYFDYGSIFVEKFLNFQLTNSQIRKSKNALKIGMKILNKSDKNPYELGILAFNSYLN